MPLVIQMHVLLCVLEVYIYIDIEIYIIYYFMFIFVIFFGDSVTCFSAHFILGYVVITISVYLLFFIVSISIYFIIIFSIYK